MVTINYKPMLVSIIIIFVIGSIIPMIINSFVPDSEPENLTTMIISLDKFINDGVCLPRTTSANDYKNVTLEYDALGNVLDTPEIYASYYLPQEAELNELCLPIASIIMPKFIRDSISENVLAFGFLPPAVSTPLLSILVISFGITLVTLGIAIATLIPFIG